MRNDETKKALEISLKKISGMIQKLAKMAEEGESCLSIVQQMDAASGLIQGARRKLVTGRLEECFNRSGTGKKSKEEFKEVLRLYDVARK